MITCKQCGAQLEDGVKFCTSCGSALEEATPVQNDVQPAPAQFQQQAYTIPPAKPLGFFEAFKLFWQNYTNFSGRSRRKEYWYMMIWNIIISLIISLVFSFDSTVMTIVNSVYCLAVFIPSIALSIRRMHDINKSGWCILVALIPFVGWIICLVWELTDSDPNPNRYGVSPKYSA